MYGNSEYGRAPYAGDAGATGSGTAAAQISISVLGSTIQTISGTATARIDVSLQGSVASIRQATASGSLALALSSRGYVAPASTPPEWALKITTRSGTAVTTLASNGTLSTSPLMDWTGQDPKHDIGAGRFKLPLSASQVALLGEDQLGHLEVRGNRVASLVLGPPDLVLVDQAGEQHETAEFPTLSLFAILTEGIVEPANGTGTSPVSADRLFDSSDPAFDASGWPGAVQYTDVATAGSTYPVTPYGVGLPGAATTGVIGPAGYGLRDDAPVGRSYVRKDFALADDGYYKIWAVFDNGGEVRLDGATIIPFTVGFGQAVVSQKIHVTAGNHTMWCYVDNGPTDPGAGPTTVALTMYSVDLTETNVTQVLETDNTWKFLPFQPVPPGFTIGRLIRLVLEEAQARGKLLDVTLSCSDTLDSRGNTWPSASDVSTKAGKTPISTFLLKELAETYADFKMRVTPSGTIVLDAFVKGTRGQTIALTYDRSNTDQIAVAGARTEATAFCVEWNEGGSQAFRYVEISPVSGHPKKEAPLSLGAARSVDEVDRVAGNQLLSFGRKRGKTTVQPKTNQSTPAAQMPGLAYWTADRVNIPFDSSYTTTSTEVIAMTWQLDTTTGQLVFTPELGDVIVPKGARATWALRKMAPPNSGGQVQPGQPLNSV